MGTRAARWRVSSQVTNSKDTALGVGARLPRKEDQRFLRGKGLYVADVTIPGTLDVAFLRSAHAHGRLLGIEIPEGKEDRVYTAARLTCVNPVRVEPSVPGFKPADHHALAT